MPGQHLQFLLKKRPRASKAHENIVVASAQWDRDHWTDSGHGRKRPQTTSTGHRLWCLLAMPSTRWSFIDGQSEFCRYWALRRRRAFSSAATSTRLWCLGITTTSSHLSSSQPSSKNNNNKSLLISTLILLLLVLVPWIDYLTIHWQTQGSMKQRGGQRKTSHMRFFGNMSFPRFVSAWLLLWLLSI